MKHPQTNREQLAVLTAVLYRQILRLLHQRLLLPLTFVAAATNALAGYIAFDATRLEIRNAAAARATAYASAAANTIRQSALVPALLAEDGQVLQTIAGEVSPEATQALNQRLARIAAKTSADAVYVMDGSGLTVASSNWDKPDSFVGRNFRFRQYFLEASQGKPSQYIALGTTSSRLGYYLSFPILSDGQFVGAVVTKLGPELLERDWSGAPDVMFVTDEVGVVLLTNRPAWRFHTLRRLTPRERTDIKASQRYPSQALLPLSLEIHGESAVLREGAKAGNYLVATLPLSEAGGRIYVLATAEPIWARTVNTVVLTVAMLTLLFAGYLYLKRRRAAVQRRVEQEEQMRTILEKLVSERTADLQTANQRLREAQGDLVQAAKLAALGQMSASLAHEMSQPIVAMRGYAENGLILLERKREDALHANLCALIAITKRMARITQHLKAFSRRAPADLGDVRLSKAVDQCLTLMNGRLRELGVLVTVTIDESVTVYADEIRLEQVLVNLMQNACDALSLVSQREIVVTAERRDELVAIFVRDTGPGVAPEILTRLFEGFFTTKPVNQGLGLGLSISLNIVEEFGGRIEVSNAADGGAVFLVVLRSAM